MKDHYSTAAAEGEGGIGASGVLRSDETILAEAESLIERLSAEGALSDTERNEAEVMVSRLEAQKDSYVKEKSSVPDTLIFALGELQVLIRGAGRSVREEYAHKDAEPDALTKILAEAGELELELIERQAAGTLSAHAEALRTRINAVLPKLESQVRCEQPDAQTILESQQAILRKFLRTLEGG